MKELVSLVKTNLRIKRNIILGEKKATMRILDMIFLFILFNALIEISLIKTFNILHSSNTEILIFNSIINIELILIVFLVFFQIMNTFYLASDWKEMFIYPIKLGNLLLSKCILCYFSSILISICALIPLFSYGILTNTRISYYFHVVLYQVIITAVPTIYLVLISLTIFWIITLVTKSKNKHKNNKWLIVIDLVVVILTYMLLNSALNNSVKTSNLLFNTFFNGSQSSEILIKFIITLSIIMISCLGFYLIGGDVYLTIMKSGIFGSKDSKKIELQPNQYEFKSRNVVISNIIRDAKLIMRIPALRFNCITVNAVFSTVNLIALISFRKEIISSGSSFEGIKSFFVTLWVLSMVLPNATLVTSFSREGRALSQFKVFPVDTQKVILSKIGIGILSNIFAFINSNILIALLSSSFVEFVLLEIVIITCMVAVSIIHIGIDLDNIELKWVNIKDLFQNGHYIKILKPYFILTLLPVIYILAARLFNIEITEYLTVIFVIFMVGIYSFYSFKKIKANMI